MLGASTVSREELAGRVPLGGHRPITNFHLVIAGIAVVVALVVISASLRMTERALGRAVEQREGAMRFPASVLTGLRMLAMSAESPVPARRYLGIEECFQKSAALPFSSTDAASHRQVLSTCAMAEKGRGILKELALVR